MTEYIFDNLHAKDSRSPVFIVDFVRLKDNSIIIQASCHRNQSDMENNFIF